MPSDEDSNLQDSSLEDARRQQSAWDHAVACVAIGFALKDTASSLTAGILILIDRPFQVGDRVAAGTRFGGYAELVTVPARAAFSLPEPLTYEQGAAIPVNYGTAYAGLVIMGGVKPGERVLMHAAAGGVGIAGTQIAKRAGAVVFGTASAGKHEAITANGVDHPIDYRNQDFAAEVMRITNGEGVDVIMDALGPVSFRKSYRSLRSGGRLIFFGLADAQSGEKRNVPALLSSTSIEAGSRSTRSSVWVFPLDAPLRQRPRRRDQ